MVKTNVEKLGISVSKLGFGAMRFPKIGEEIDQEQVNQMIKHAFDNGVNYFDTAYVYGGGASEIALGKALKQFNREDFFVADKLPFWGCDSEQYLKDAFQTSLDRVGVDYFDFYLLHNMSPSTYPACKEFKGLEYAIELKKQGKIKYLGFSIHADHDFLNEMLALHDFDFVQIQYNYLDENDAPGKAGYEELVKRNMPIIIMEPLKGGLLSDIPDAVTGPFKELGGSNVSYAFKWLAEKANIMTILSGMSTLEQTKENVALFQDIAPLTEKEHKAIEQVKKNIEERQKNKCTGCRYCMPCPFEVEIAPIFKAWNTLALHGSDNWISGTEIDYDSAAKCVSCGACMTHCPQNIDIPTCLQQVVAEKPAN